MISTTEISTENTIIISLKEHENLKKENASLRFEVAKLKTELAQLKRMIFGARSERFVSSNAPEQLALGLEFGELPSKPVEKQQIAFERKKPSKNKNKAVRASIPDHLPRTEERIEPETIPEGAKPIGEAVTEILEYKPGNLFVRRILRPKYALPQEEGVVIGDLPTLPIPKGNAGSGLLAHILISKFTDHLPFYRQRQMLKRQGLEIAESTINGWFSATCELINPLYNTLCTRVLATNYLQADETPISVLTCMKPGSTHKGYHWVYHAPVEKRVLFDYRSSRSREGPQEILEGFRGTLQTHGYAGYNNFENQRGITLLACMAHARRKFNQAKDNDHLRAEYALCKIQELYATEQEAREAKMNYDQRKTLRQKDAVPVLEELEVWLKTELTEVLPKSTISKAISYTLNLWPRLKRYVEDGRCEIDNNLIENQIRPVALGRKNYLFAGSHQAAQRAAMIYSLLGTCKLNDVEPLAWLTDILTRIPDHPVNRLEELLPPNWQHITQSDKKKV